MPYIESLSDICSRYNCEMRTEEPLSAHTTFRIGGRCRSMILINSIEALSEIYRFLKVENIPCFVLGKGSNVIASDEGYDGVILKMGKAFSEIKVVGGTEIFCTAGAMLTDACRTALENSLTGMEFAYGIPGTCGGALFMNAGAYGGEIRDIIRSARFLDKKGCIHEISADDMKLSYRHSLFSEFREYIIIDMVFSLEKGKKTEIKLKMDDLLKRRKDKQPLEYPSAGSTFKRPEGSYASLLIEQCGLKGMSCGGAQVSEKHSGFVINKGGATSKDVLELTDRVAEIVREKTGYQLELEPLVLK